MASSRGDVARHANRIAEVNREASWFYAIDEARQQRGAGQVAQQRRRSQEPRTPPQERHSHAIAAQMPVHKNGNHLVFAETPANLESGVERLPHFERIRPETLANGIPNAIDVGVRLCHRDDRELCGHGTAHQEASHLPIAAMAGHDDDAAPFGKQPLEKLVGLGRVIEQVWCVWRSESAKEIDAVERVGAEGCERPALQGLVALFRKNRAKVVGDGRPARAHQPPCDPRADRPDRVRHRPRQHSHAVIGRAENEPVVEPVQRPASRHDAVAADVRHPYREDD